MATSWHRSDPRTSGRTPRGTLRAAFRPRIRTILLAVNLVLICLPLSGVWLLRLYESALIRQTESELIAQGAVLGATFRADWLAEAGPGALAAMPTATAEIPVPDAGPWTPRFAVLDLADDPILPPPAPAETPTRPPEPIAQRVGDRLQPVIDGVRRVTLAGIRLLDAGGIVVASSGQDRTLSLAGQAEAAAALAGTPVASLRLRTLTPDERSDPPLASISRGGNLRVFVALPVIEDGRVLGALLLSRTPRSIGQALLNKAWHLAGLAAVLVAGGAVLAWVTARTISRPLTAVTDQARRTAAGERSAVVPLAHYGTREVADLSASLVTMAATLEARADYIRAFAAEVSHEFKTPLAAIRGTVEVLRDHLAGMSAGERERFLGNLDADAERLDRLVRRLLDLARADMLRPAGGERVEIGTVVVPLVEAYRRDGLDVAIPPEQPGLVAAIDRDGLETVLRNLLDNMAQHAGPGAAGRIRWHAEDGMACLTVEDDGAGISAGNAARIFDRFFTTARTQGGTGLGLTIARSRLAAHGGTIELAPRDRGTCFVVGIPLAPGDQRGPA